MRRRCPVRSCRQATGKHIGCPSRLRRTYGRVKQISYSVCFVTNCRKTRRSSRLAAGLRTGCSTCAKRAIECSVSIRYQDSLMRARAFNPELGFLTGSVTRLPLAAHSLDVCVPPGVIGNFDEGPGTALQETGRVLRPWGIAIIEPSLDSISRLSVANSGINAAVSAKMMLGYK